MAILDRKLICVHISSSDQTKEETSSNLET